MLINVQLTREPIGSEVPAPDLTGQAGAWAEFRGIVRGEEAGRRIAALEYEAYAPMAVQQMEKILHSLAVERPCLAARVVHRLGVIRAGETAIYVGIAAKHRGEAFALLAAFMDRLKQDVPIWKCRALELNDESGRSAELQFRSGETSKGASARAMGKGLETVKSSKSGTGIPRSDG